MSGQDIDENYRLVSNDACPEGMPSLSFFLVMKEWGKQLKNFWCGYSSPSRCEKIRALHEQI